MHEIRKVAPYAARLAEILLAAVFLAGAVLKARDINLFTVQIAHYGVISKPDLLTVAALGTLGIETGLGVALLLGVRLRGLTFIAMFALLTVFTGLIGYGWAFHNLKDCGCFGAFEMSPGVSIVKNAALMLLAIAAGAGYLYRERTRARVWASALRVSVCVIAACALVAYGHTHLQAAPKGERPFANFVFDAEGVHYDLGSGEYFAAVLSMTCEDCMESVERINQLAETPGVPPVVALCYEEKPGALEDFRARTGPVFPLYSIGDQVRLFAVLLGSAQFPPRFVYLRDGDVIREWYETVPDPDAVLAAAAGAKAGEARH